MMDKESIGGNERSDKYIGKILNHRYRILELIGSGGMAVVYLAFDMKTNCKVAVKIMREELSCDPQFKLRFENESKAIAMMSHANIVDVVEVYNSDKFQYIVMEYIDGITLKEYIDQQHILKWKEAVFFSRQILRALQHAHNRGIIHRDIKPQNIMLLEDGTIKVADFGIAMFYNEECSAPSGKAIGSVHYISPEQASGETVDERSDIYSVGVIMYEMLTGRVPFDADDPVKVAVMQMHNDPVNPCELNPSVPLGLKDIIMRAMAKTKAMRYQHATEMIRDLDELRRDPNVRFNYKGLTGEAGETAAIPDEEDKEQRNPSGVNYGKKRREKSSTLQILAAVASAFVFTAVVTFSVLTFKYPHVLGLSIGRTVNEVTVPELAGMSLSDAKVRYASSFNFVEKSYEYSDEMEPGIIISQSPKSGRTVREGATIKLVISQGVYKTVVPAVVNTDYREAQATLNKLGITLKFEREYSDTVVTDYIIRTEPAAGAEVKSGDTIKIVVSRGAEPKTLKMPSLVGLTLTQAKKVLEDNKLYIGKTVYVANEAAVDTVLTQSVMAGAEIDEYTTVNLTLSTGSTAQMSRSLTFVLPTNMGNTINVKIDFDDSVILDGTFNVSDESITFTVFGSGSKVIRIYVNNQLYDEDVVVFK